MKNTLREDLTIRLPDVERVWLRRIATIMLTVIVFIPMLIIGILQGVYDVIRLLRTDFFLDCWHGRN